MDTKSVSSGLIRVLALAALAVASAGAYASGSRGTALDTYCAGRPAGTAIPQQSRPYRASGSNCSICHTTTNNRGTGDLNALGGAARTGGAAMDPFCINTAPTNPAITAPAANTTVALGTSVTFTGSATEPDNFTTTNLANFPLTYAWTFSGGLPPATGESVLVPMSVTVPMTVAGTITATLEVRDANGAVAATRPTRSVTVTSANQAPNGSITPPASVVRGQAVTFTGSGTDPDGNTPLRFAWSFGTSGIPASTAQNPSVSFNTAGTFTVTLTVTDSLGLADPSPATVQVTVAPANQAPNGSITPPASVVQGQAAAFQGSATDPDGDTVTYAWSFGANATPATSTAQNPSVTFSTTGTRTVTLTVTDSRGLADPTPATAQITVAAAPPVPVACADADRDGFSPTGGPCGPVDCNDNNAAINPGAAEACGDGIDNDCDGATDTDDKECDGTDCLARFFASPVVITSASWESDDDQLTVRGSQAQAGAAVTVFNAGSGALIGATVAGSTGSWSLEREDVSPAPCSVRAEINGRVAERAVSNAPSPCAGGANPPVANADSYSVVGGSALTVVAPGVLGNDTSPSGRALSASLVSGAGSGSLSLASNGGFTFTPAVGFSGTVTFTYRASDGTSSSAAATVTIAVSAPNQAPNGSIAAPTGNVSVAQGQTVSFQGSGTDPDGNLPLTYSWDFGGAAAASTQQNPSVLFNTVGTYTVRLTVRDARGLADPTPASVVVTVAAANRAPNGTISSPTGNITVRRGQSVSFRGTGSDPDGNTPLTYSWSFGGGASSSTRQNPTRSFNTSGTYTVRLTVRDSRGLADPTPATVTVTVTGGSSDESDDD